MNARSQRCCELKIAMADEEREREEDWEREQSRKRKGGLGYEAPAEDAPAEDTNPADVAAHYNKLQDRHRSLTAGSDILHLRNLNNWYALRSLSPPLSLSAASDRLLAAGEQVDSGTTTSERRGRLEERRAPWP